MPTNNLAHLTARSAQLPAGELSRLQSLLSGENRRFIVTFDASTNESLIWTIPSMPNIYSGNGTLRLDIQCIMESATSGDVDLDVEIEAITPADTVDMDTTSSFDSVNSTDNTSVPATAGYLFTVTVDLTNDDSVAVGDYVRIRLTRDATSDTATGDLRVLGALLYEDETVSEVYVHSGNGHGSTNTAIRRFTTASTETGSSITRATSASAGDSFTINDDGVYSIFYSDQSSSTSSAHGISVNASSLTTNIGSLSVANGKVAITSSTSANEVGFVSAVLSLSATDVVRPHTNTNPNLNSNDNVIFHIMKIG